MYIWLCKCTKGNLTRGSIDNNLIRKKNNFDKHILSNFFTSRYMEWSWEFIFTRKYLPIYYYILYKPKN